MRWQMIRTMNLRPFFSMLEALAWYAAQKAIVAPIVTAKEENI